MTIVEGTTTSDVLGPIVSLYATEAARALEREGRPADRALVSFSPPTWDSCCEGMVWARIVGIEPQNNQQGAAGPNPCGIHGLTVNLAVGVLRCVSTVDSKGRAPKPTDITDEALTQIDDLQALRDGILSIDRTRTLDSWEPLGPQGGCAGGEWTFTIRVDNCVVPLAPPEI